MQGDYLKISKIFGAFKVGQYGLINSDSLNVKCLGNENRQFVLEGFSEDENKDEYFGAILNLINLDSIKSEVVTGAIYEYYLDNASSPLHEMSNQAKIDEIWDQVYIGDEIYVKRRPWGDKKIYLSISSGCEWECEHGLEIVIKEGLYVNKIGQYDGHCTNSDAYDREEYEDVIYISSKRIEGDFYSKNEGHLSE